jgi:hypothetical protein
MQTHDHHDHDPHTCNDPTHNHGPHGHHHAPVAQLKQELKDDSDDGIYNYDIFAIERRERELLEKYPDQAQKIKKAMTIDHSDVMKKKEHEMSLSEIHVYRAQLQREKADRVYTEKKAERVPNMTFEKQRSI